MNGPPTPRRVIKSILRGEPPQRPLLMPIMFGLGARIQNLPFRDFCGSPTKIAAALRQISNVYRMDGAACYFDPLLEAEVLGCKLSWNADSSHGSLASAPPVDALPALDAIGQNPRVRLVCDVVKRSKVMLPAEPALMVRVTGPLTLAAQLSGATENPADSALLEFAAQLAERIAREYVEAGADSVFLVEEQLPTSPLAWQQLSSLLEPVVNMIRFYEALPVLLLTSALTAESAKAMLTQHWDCLLCPSADPVEILEIRGSEKTLKGRALPPAFFEEDPAVIDALIRSTRARGASGTPLLLTSSADIPPSADPRKLAEGLTALRSALSPI